MRKNCLLSTLVLILTLLSEVTNAQDFSNKGKNFWISYPEHINGTGSIMGLYITSDVNTTGVISINGVNTPFTVTANTITPRFITNTGVGANVIGVNNYIHLGNLQDGIKTNAAVHVTSVLPVVVYAHIINSARSVQRWCCQLMFGEKSIMFQVLPIVAVLVLVRVTVK